jgi:hypothetical protein
LRVLTTVVTVYVALAAMWAPASSTTWMGAWLEAATVGAAAGLVVVWINRTRRGEPGRIGRFVTGLALVSIVAGLLESVTRPRRPGRF